MFPVFPETLSHTWYRKPINNFPEIYCSQQSKGENQSTNYFMKENPRSDKHCAVYLETVINASVFPANFLQPFNDKTAERLLQPIAALQNRALA